MGRFHEHFRTLQHYWADPDWLRDRMLFVSGPRQVGKTTLVTHTLCTEKAAYFNWDNRKIRLAYQKDADFFAGSGSEWICFDEIHKRPKWKDILKGIYDTHKERYRFVITGSARLDTFKKSGDSLVGRYFHTTLFPINLPDIHKTDFRLPEKPLALLNQAADTPDSPAFEELLACGGFPEPFFAGTEQFWKRWSDNHRDLILTEDLRDISKITEIDKIESLLEMLDPCIGKPLSYSNFARDLETTHGSIRRWLEMLSRVQLVFAVPPYSKKVSRAYTQEKKWYFTDWRAAGGNVFENYVASALYRAVRLYTDRFGEKMALYFVRTHDGTEVDFLLCREGKPWLLVEAKQGQAQITRGVYRFAAEFGVPCLVATRKKNFFKKTKGSDNQTIIGLSWSRLGALLP